jgi:hypothetical protein
MIENAYQTDPEELLKITGTNFKTGLSSGEAEERLLRHGTNTLDTGERYLRLKFSLTM